MPAKPIVALMPLSECAMRKISSTVSRSSGLLLDAHDGEVELLEVLARLGEEHRQVLGGSISRSSGRRRAAAGRARCARGSATRSVEPTTR